MNTRKTFENLPLLENIGRQKSILTGLILGKIYELRQYCRYTKSPWVATLSEGNLGVLRDQRKFGPSGV